MNLVEFVRHNNIKSVDGEEFSHSPEFFKMRQFEQTCHTIGRVLFLEPESYEVKEFDVVLKGLIHEKWDRRAKKTKRQFFIDRSFRYPGLAADVERVDDAVPAGSSIDEAIALLEAEWGRFEFFQRYDLIDTGRYWLNRELQRCMVEDGRVVVIGLESDDGGRYDSDAPVAVWRGNKCDPQLAIVYCKDVNRPEDYRRISFDFLGYTFRPRRCVTPSGRVHPNFLPAISQSSKKEVSRRIRSWHMQLKNEKSLLDLSRMFDPILRGWYAYYGRFYPSALRQLWRNFNRYLVRWVRRNYKRLARHKGRAKRYLDRFARAHPNLFVPWRLGVFPCGSSGRSRMN